MMHKAAVSGDMTGLTDKEIDMVNGYRNVLPEHALLEVSTYHESSDVHPMHFGTIDAAWSDDGVLHILDFKTGKWPVKSEGNWQLIGYASERAWDEYAHIRLGIYQPHVSKHIQWANYTYETFKSYNDAYKAAAQKVFHAPELVPGDHCKFCPAEKICPKVRGLIKPASTEW